MITLKNVALLKYCLKFLYPNFNPYLLLIYFMIKLRIPKSSDRLRLIGLPRKIYEKIVLSSISKKEIRDYTKCLIVSEKIHKKLLSENIFFYDSGSVWMCAVGVDQHEVLNQPFHFLNLQFDHVSKKKKRQRIVQIIGSKEIPDSFIGCLNVEERNIHDLFWFNHQKEDVFLTLHSISNLENIPRIAEKALVHLINDEYDIPSEMLTQILSNFFEHTKMLYVNDVFEVTNIKQYAKISLNNMPENLYFRCLEISANLDKSDLIDLPYFIVKGRTEMKIGENIHSFKPYKKYLELNNNGDTLIDTCPGGLKDHFVNIEKSMLPFLIKSLTNILHETTSQSMMPLLLLTGAFGTGKRLLIKLIAEYHGFHHLPVDCTSLQSSTFKQTESKISSLIQRAKEMSPAVVTLDNFHKLAADDSGEEDSRILDFLVKSLQSLYENFTKHPIIFVAATTKGKLNTKINRIFIDKHHLTKLDSAQTRENLKWFIDVLNLKIKFMNTEEPFCPPVPELIRNSNVLDARFEKMVGKLEGLSHGEMDIVFHFAQKKSYLRQVENGTVCPDFCMIDEQDIYDGLEHLRDLQSQHVDRPKIPKVYWDDIGGLQELKKELIKTIELPIKYPHLFKNTLLQRSGILLYGPPGCGKTLVAKAVSTELKISFLSVKGPELLNMYIGQSEENVRNVFESARQSSPCLVFLDELDSLAPRRGATGDSGGASDRVVSQLLAEIDGVVDGSGDGKSTSVFVMGATNRPDLLEQSLLRPGRLDKLIYVGPYVGEEEKVKVLTALCRKYKLESDVSLEDVSKLLPERCTGADLLHVTSSARSAAVKKRLTRFREGKIKQSQLNSEDLTIEMKDLLEGVGSFKPSISDEEFQYYESLKSQI